MPEENQLEKQSIVELKNPLLEKLIKTYYENEENKTTQVSLDNRELRQLILLVKCNLAKEQIIDYELFQRKEEKKNFRKEN